MTSRRSLDRSREDVDAALDVSRRDVTSAALPPALRARILAAARPVRAPAPRGRLLDFALRAAGVAAAIAAVMLVLPVPLEAAEFDGTPLAEWNGRIAATVSDHLPGSGLSAALDLPETLGVCVLPMAAAAVVLVGTGLWLARRGRRP